MKAANFDGQKIFFDENYSIKKKIDESQPPKNALVKVSLAGICGTDLEILNGYMQYRGILGHEFVGIVEKAENFNLIGKRVVGEINAGCNVCEFCTSGVTRHCPDRTVLGILNRDGAFAEYLFLPEKNLHIIPDTISDEQAVFIESLAAAFEIKEQIQLQPQWNIAVVGDGRLAFLILSVLRLSCPNVVCFGRHQSKLDNIEKLKIKTKIGVEESSDNQFYDLVVEKQREIHLDFLMQ